MFRDGKEESIVLNPLRALDCELPFVGLAFKLEVCRILRLPNIYHGI